ncbi:MupG family TIM beta-alpha barrel fold protein [Lysinibacillus sp. MHQ-1]|nr:MupG family TIM beta-alpha barrel fold protein [Lysinibacillus sp. MHQ-1]
MKRLGISLYPQHSTLDEMKRYVQLAHDNGFDRIFYMFDVIKAGRRTTEITTNKSICTAIGL